MVLGKQVTPPASSWCRHIPTENRVETDDWDWLRFNTDAPLFERSCGTFQTSWVCQGASSPEIMFLQLTSWLSCSDLMRSTHPMVVQRVKIVLHWTRQKKTKVWLRNRRFPEQHFIWPFNTWSITTKWYKDASFEAAASFQPITAVCYQVQLPVWK